MTTLVRRVHFSAGHTYAFQKAGSGFGHNFVLDVFFRGEIDQLTGMIVNLSDVDLWMKELIQPLDHHYLNNDVEFFRVNVPSAENIARFSFERLRELMTARGTLNEPHASVTLVKVRLYEGEDLWVDYSDQPLEDE